jgi:hypothetical protein
MKTVAALDDESPSALKDTGDPEGRGSILSVGEMQTTVEIWANPHLFIILCS